MNNMSHYRGFIDACASFGIEKEAADQLYKNAQILSGIGTGLGKAVKGTLWAGSAGKTLARNVATGVGTKATRLKNFVVQKGTHAVEAARAYGRYAADQIGSAYRATGAPVPNIDVTPVTNFAKNVGHAITSPTSTIYKFIKNHPFLSTAGAVYLGATAFNPIDAQDRESVERMRKRTLTPSEKIMYDRLGSGMNLPGFGLDPMYFNNINERNNLLQYLQY